MIPIFWTKVLFVLGLAFGIAWIVALSHEHGLHPAGWLAAELRNRPIWETAFLAIIVTGFIHHGATKGTNGVPARAGGGMESISPPIPQSSNPPLPQFPAGGAVTNTDWLACGGYEDWFHIPDGGWCFRFGSNLTERLTVFAFGEVRTSPHDVSNRISLLGLPLSIVPAANWHLIAGNGNYQLPAANYQLNSLFWHAITSSNSLLLTWRNALVNRDTNLPVTVQAELFPDGAAALRYDFAGLGGGMSAISNAAARIWRDGVEETVPLQTGTVTAVEFPAPPVMDTNALDEVYARVAGGDSNAYYFAEAVVGKGPARIKVETDGDSALGGYRLMAEPGVTNRLPFLIGPRYAVSSEVAFSHFALVPSELQMPESHPSATNITDRLVEVQWPVEFGLDEVSASPAETVYALHVVPEFLCGTVLWSGAAADGPMRGAPPLRSGGDGCTCGCQSHSTNTVSHASSCPCGDCSVSGDYGYEGHSEHFELPFPDAAGGDPPAPPNPGGDPDPPDPTGPSVTVSFEKPVVIFEDQYENSPGVFVARRSSTTKLTVTAYGGENGGTLSLTVVGGLDICAGQSGLPGYVPPGQTIEWEANYEGVAASDRVGGAQVTARLMDFVTVETTDASDSLTVVEVIRTAVATTPAERSRTNLGVGEVVNIAIRPASPLAIVSAGVGSLSAQNQQGCWVYLSPRQACNDTLTVAVADETHTINLSIVEPNGFVVRSIAGFNNAGENVAGAFSADIYYFPLPTNVSFYALDFVEIGMIADDATGYFTNSVCASWLDHSQNGAGEWIWLNTFDDKFVDTVAMPPLPEPWNDGGGFTWPIPVAWRFHDEVGVTNVICNHNQRFELDANGTSRIRKMGCLVERATNNFFRALKEN